MTGSDHTAQPPFPIPSGSLTWAPPGASIGFVWPPESDDIQCWAVDRDPGTFLVELPGFSIAAGAEGDNEALERDRAAFIAHVKDFLGFPKWYRPSQVLILEAPSAQDDLDLEEIKAIEVFQGSLNLFAAADEVYIFRGTEAATLKHADRAPEDVRVAIQRRS